MFSRSVYAIAAKNANSSGAAPMAVVAGPGEHLQDQAVGGEMVGEHREFGGAAASSEATIGRVVRLGGDRGRR